VETSGASVAATSGRKKQSVADHNVSTLNRLYDAYIFDLDGTIYLGDGLLPGAKRLISELRNRHIPVRFISNNPTKDPVQYAEKLTKLGLPTQVDEVVNSVVATTRWLLENYPTAVVFPIGEAPLIHALKNANIRTSSQADEIDIVIASYDRTFTYEKLQIAFDAIWFHKRARLIATNPDRYCPMVGGRGEPDAASIIAAIEACTSTKCEVVVGKPSSIMLHMTLEGLHVDVKNCAMVGDRLATDIQMARNTGLVSVLVLTGETKVEDLKRLSAQEQPGFVLERIDQVLPSDIWEELGWSKES